MSPNGRARFSELLIDRGLVTADDLARAQTHAAREQLELADALVVLGLLAEAVSYEVLAAAARTTVTPVDLVASSELAVQLVPERLARRHLIVPLMVDNRTLTYATCLPFSAEAERDLGFATGRRTSLTVATRSAVLHALDRCYPKLRYLDALADQLRGGATEPAALSPERDAASVIAMCHQIMRRAVEVGASHVIMECGAQSGTIRYQVRGAVESLPALHAAVSHPIRDRFKIMARVATAVRHRAQEGTFRLTLNGRPTDVRLSTRPGETGEQIVMEILADGTAAGAAAAPARGRARSRVLVTDDDPITRMLVKLLLEREHYDVVEAVNGDQAVEIALRDRPNLLIIDLNMPVMDGYQAIHHLRKSLSMAALPIIVLTAQDGQRIERHVLELGANDYIIKPFDPGVLMARVAAVFGRLQMMAA